ncbi:hypothetical protein E0H26_11720 [Micromonospora zingiberis]|uniref:Head-tail adaptor protein n=1 Tax=Micromonospora zingiberis TaxID=2053011 RepID=A0A4R0GJF5_9ACTN|nr:hypothetical protein [Micromonospora zingiberis]TCB97580.1 hypothetical protein E0H26_11720 [Micromonospora zingiberis]
MNWAEFIAAHIPEPSTVLVEPYAGSGAYGDVYGEPVEVTPCIVEETRRLVRVQTQDAAGREQVSSTTVFAPLDTTCPAGSRVTWNGRTARVLAVSRVEAHGLPLPEHLEISLE